MAGRVIKGSGAEFRPLDWAAPLTLPSPASRLGAQPASDQDLHRAHQRGYQEGQAAARDAQEQVLAGAQRTLAQTLAELVSVRTSICRQAQGDLVRLAVAIARRIIHREMLLAPDILEGICSTVLVKLDRQEIYRVRVHPQMAPGVDLELKRCAPHREIKVTADLSLDLGGCIFETSRGNVDASIDSQLVEIERGLADRIEGRT